MVRDDVNVAMVEPVGGHGGMDYYDFGLCGGLAAAGVDAKLYTSDETDVSQAQGFTTDLCYRGIYGSAPSWQRGLRYVRGSMAAIWSAFREGRQVCHLHFFHVDFRQVVDVLLAKVLGRKLVITTHDVESFVDALEVPMLSRWAYAQADRVIAHNWVSRDELMARLAVPAEKIDVIPHGNYLHMLGENIEKVAARTALGLQESSKVVLFFGQIKDVKGLDVLIEAMESVATDMPDAVLLIAGKPWKSDFAGYQRKIEAAGLQDRCVCHIRYIPDVEVPLYYGAADLIALPYRRIYQSGVVLMAMSYGKAVLVSDLPGMTEVVENGVSGFVFPEGDASALAGILMDVLSNEALREQVAANGHARMQADYGWDRIGEKTQRLYQSLCV